MKKLNIHQMKNIGMTYLTAAILLVLASCSSPSESTESKAPEPREEPATESLVISGNQFQSSAMKLGKLEEKAFHERVRANGMLDVPPQNHAAVSSYYGGTVKGFSLLPGQQVKQGQVLLTLENPEYILLQQEYLEAKGQLAYLESDYQRQKNLAQDNVSSQKKYLKAESEYKVTQAKMASLDKQLKLMGIDPQSLSIDNIRSSISLKAPISGYVTEVNVSQGEFLDPSKVAVNIVSTDHMHVELNIFEKDLAKVRVGQMIQFSLQEDRGKTYEAKVHLVNKTVDPDKRTVNIHGHLLNEKDAQKFNPGMYVEAEIFTTSDSSFALPQEAVVEIEGIHYALVLTQSSKDDYSFEKTTVQVGRSHDSFVEIQNAAEFKPGTQFLTSGAFNLITE